MFWRKKKTIYMIVMNDSTSDFVTHQANLGKGEIVTWDNKHLADLNFYLQEGKFLTCSENKLFMDTLCKLLNESMKFDAYKVVKTQVRL
jgi:hypothetical protein